MNDSQGTEGRKCSTQCQNLRGLGGEEHIGQNDTGIGAVSQGISQQTLLFVEKDSSDEGGAESQHPQGEGNHKEIVG